MVRYYTQDCRYDLKQRRIINRWLKESAAAEGFRLADVNVIFCSSRHLLAMNNEYLQHNYYTDIITFDYSDLEEAKIIAGDLFIDIETVADNAAQYGATPIEEMHRILIHGVMHLCGQGDKSEQDAKDMRAKENLYLSRLEL